MNLRKISKLTCAFLAVMAAGCAIGPKYERPTALPAGARPDQFEQAEAGDWKTAEPAAHIPKGNWWSIFGDPELDRLEELAGNANQELAAAANRYEQARAVLSISRSGYFPHISASPAAARQRTSENAFDRASTTYNSFSVPLEAGWELDLWGRVRQQVAAAKARLDASADDLGAARLAIQGDVAANYFTLLSLQTEGRLLEQTAEAFRRSFELTMNRRKGGVASELDVSQAETQLKAVEALLPAIELQRIRTENALAILCGAAPSQFTTTLKAELPPALRMDAEVPSALLERRPDIASAERQMAGANAEVGVAQTAFYPRVTFNGLAGLQSIDAGALFSWPSRVWALGPTVELPIFTGGRNRAELAFARAGYRETVAAYRQTVLRAFQEIEDQLAAQRLLDVELSAEQSALESARRTLQIAQNRYTGGLVTFLEVATAQSAALERERTVVRLRAERLTANVALVRALGGGWHAPAAVGARAQAVVSRTNP